jgi:hypothetical protein
MGKTYRSTDEAFKGADYSTPMWRCETERERGWRMVRGLGAVILGVGLSVWFVIALVDWLKGFPNG